MKKEYTEIGGYKQDKDFFRHRGTEVAGFFSLASIKKPPVIE